MTARIQQLKTALETALSGKIVSLTEGLGELVLEVKSQDYPAVARALHDTPSLGFEQLYLLRDGFITSSS